MKQVGIGIYLERTFDPAKLDLSPKGCFAQLEHDQYEFECVSNPRPGHIHIAWVQMRTVDRLSKVERLAWVQLKWADGDNW